MAQSQDFLDQLTQVGSSNSGDRKHRDASAVLPFVGLTGSKFPPTRRTAGVPVIL